MPRYEFRMPCLFLDADLPAGHAVALERAQSDYLLNVLRLKQDDGVLVFNGCDGEWKSRIIVTGRKACALELEEQTRPQTPKPDLLYCFAPSMPGSITWCRRQWRWAQACCSPS